MVEEDKKGIYREFLDKLRQFVSSTPFQMTIDCRKFAVKYSINETHVSVNCPKSPLYTICMHVCIIVVLQCITFFKEMKQGTHEDFAVEKEKIRKPAWVDLLTAMLDEFFLLKPFRNVVIENMLNEISLNKNSNCLDLIQ